MARRPRVPQKTDFPASITLSVIPPRNNSTVASVLLLLHGLGDSEIPFSDFARSMALPGTVCIALRAPHPIPAILTGSNTPAFHWSDDLLFDEHNFTMDSDGGFSRAKTLLEEVFSVLVHRCNFEPRDLLILGFGQGAMVGLGWVAKMHREEQINGGFGGVVAIGSGLPKEALSWLPETPSAMIKTPLLICGGNSRTEVTKEVMKTLSARFSDLRYVKWDRQGDGMPKSRQEMLPIMEFFALRLRSRAGVPDDALEI